MQENKDGEQKFYNRFGHSKLIFFISVFSIFLNASTFSEFKRSQSDAFVTYKNKNDKLFNDYLKSNWEKYDSKKFSSFYTLAKPSKILPTKSSDVIKLGPKVHIDIHNEKEILVELKVKKVIKDINFDFFGRELALNVPSNLRKAKFYPQNQKGISNFFNALIVLEYEKFIVDINKLITDLALNDWGRYLLIKKISENIFSSQDDARLLSWFIFNKLGYSLRVGLSNKHIIVMYHSKIKIYDTPIYTINKKKFYVLSNYAKGLVARVFTYEQDYPKSNKAFDLSLEFLPKLKENLQTKNLEFNQNGKNYKFTYRYNQNILDFMKTYPQTDYETFFNAPMEIRTYNDIANGLRKYINAKSSSEAINFVLHFVQNAFKYQVDADQFGKEKVMFAEETLYYENSDCEDRAILFAYLVKRLFKIGVVGVKYKDHMTTALYIPIKGDSVSVNSKKYVIADPTYVNSNIGQSMGRYKLQKPKSFIYLKKIKG